jgi:hypothetical protein
MSRWCPVCAERYTGPEPAHARECRGFRPVARRRQTGQPGYQLRLDVANGPDEPVSAQQPAHGDIDWGGFGE